MFFNVLPVRSFQKEKNVSPNTCAVGVANQRTDSPALSYPDIKVHGHGQQNTDFWPRPRMTGTSSAQLQLRTRCACFGKVGHWA